MVVLQTLDQPTFFQRIQQRLHRLFDTLLMGLDGDLGVFGGLKRRVDPGEAFDLAGPKRSSSYRRTSCDHDPRGSFGNQNP